MNKDKNTSRILVVEDDLDVRESLHDVLGDAGIAAVGAANGAEALQYPRTAREAPPLILLNLMMPVMDGFQFREVQRQHPDWMRIPVVALTADGNASEKAARVGAVASLKRPVDLEELYECVSRYLGTGG